jgi:hypothetical protein
MFTVTKQTHGKRGAFVKLVVLDSDDYAVIIRSPDEARLHQRYVGPDVANAEEIFQAESEKLGF